MLGREVNLLVDARQLLGAAFRYYGFSIAALLFGVSLVVPMGLPHFWHNVVSAAAGLGAFLLCQWHLCKTVLPSRRYDLRISEDAKPSR